MAWPYFNSIRQLAMLIRELNISLVHTNCDFCLPYVQRACILLRQPYVSHVRDFVRGWFRPPNLSALRSARKVIANSKAIANACIQYGIPDVRVSTIYNPINVESFVKEVHDLRKELNIPLTTLVIGIVGQIHEEKGHQEFVEVALELAITVPNIAFLIVGKAPDTVSKLFEQKLQERVAASQYASRFYFTGFRNDIERVMQTLDILVVPSWNEPFGRVAVEGMVAGKVVIGTQVGGLPEIITHCVNGLLVPPRDPETLRDVLKKVLAQPELRLKLSSAGQLSSQRFSVAYHVNNLEALYSSILKAHENCCLL